MSLSTILDQNVVTAPINYIDNGGSDLGVSGWTTYKDKEIVKLLAKEAIKGEE